mgnify:CR=1 FL=1
MATWNPARLLEKFEAYLKGKGVGTMRRRKEEGNHLTLGRMVNFGRGGGALKTIKKHYPRPFKNIIL